MEKKDKTLLWSIAVNKSKVPNPAADVFNSLK
jgi:hypothetical protein